MHAAVGGITESDINLALASKAVVIGFNVRADAQARKLAENNGVQIRYYDIIYDAVDDVKAALSGHAHAGAEGKRSSAWSRCARSTRSRRSAPSPAATCSKASCKRGAKVRVLRDNVVIHDGELDSLKRFKDDVREVKARLRVRPVDARTSTTSRRATSSRCTRSSKCRARCSARSA